MARPPGRGEGLLEALPSVLSPVASKQQPLGYPRGLVPAEPDLTDLSQTAWTVPDGDAVADLTMR